MKLITIAGCAVVLSCMFGCKSDAPDNANITSTANQLKQESQGKPQAPPIPGLQQAGGGGGANAGPKPHGAGK